MNNDAIWASDKMNLSKRNIPKKINTDILIIGGGISGLTTAYFLKNSKKKITLIDASDIGFGVTGKTTAKITYLQGSILDNIYKTFGLEVTKRYLNSQIDAVNLIKDIVTKNKIECDLVETPSIIFTSKNSGIEKINRIKKLLNNLDILNKDFAPENCLKALEVFDTYTFNPIKYLLGLYAAVKDKINIYTHVMAQEIKEIDDKYLVKTTKCDIVANKVIVACHYPFFIVPGFIPLKTYIKREFVNASKIEKVGNFSAINVDSKLHSIRFYKDYLIYGSTEQKLTDKTNYKIGYENSRDEFYKNFNKESELTWMNQDVMSHDYLPFIGYIKKNLYIMTAYNAWGMTNGTIGAKVISNLILNHPSNYISLFDPKRCNMHLLWYSFIGAFIYLKAMILSLFVHHNPYYIKIKGIIYALYKDSKGVKHIIRLICPHMRSCLVFNKEEETWDCPCHGSRFNIDGKVIEGPATKDLQEQKNTN